jgi:hypothetical protein
MADNTDFAMLRDDYAELLRAHTRAIWALKGDGEGDYPETERNAMGEHASKVLSWARGVEPRNDDASREERQNG